MIYFAEKSLARPPHLGGEQWRLTHLNHINVIFGKNGSGKSRLLRDLRDSDTAIYHYTSPERGGDITNDLGIMQQQLEHGQRASRRPKNLSEQFRQEAISRVQALLLKMAGAPGGTPLSSAKEDIEEAMGILLPEFEFKITSDKGAPFEMHRLPDRVPVTSVTALSSGEAEIMTLALDLLTICCMWEMDIPAQTKVLLIDEPDTHLHPDLQQHLADFLVRLVDKYAVQIIIATHSTTLLSALGYYGQDRTSVIYLSSAQEEQRAMPFNTALQELATCLGGHALMGPLFGVPLLLVEGDDDYKIWSQVPRHNKVHFAVIPCKGEEIHAYQQVLEKVLHSMRDTSALSGYALLDGDKALPTPSAAQPQDHIKYLGLACHEAENLYLSDEVLTSLGHLDWAAACTRIKAEAANHGAISTQLSQCDQWDRKNMDLKGLIGAVSKILDPNGTDWCIRIGKCLGANRPTGQLLDFLGQPLVDALWGTVAVPPVAPAATAEAVVA